MALNKNELAQFIYDYVKNTSPIDTGNLRHKGIYGPYPGNGDPYFVVGGDLAPYGALLNNAKTIKGRPNIHYKWINKAVEIAVGLFGAEVVESNL